MKELLSATFHQGCLPDHREGGTLRAGTFRAARVQGLAGILVLLLQAGSPVGAGAAGSSFQYPPPPTEGEREYFPIAAQGRPLCVVVAAADAPPSVQRAAAALRDYLQRATGAPIPLVADNAAPADSLASLHVGDTSTSKTVPLNLPALQYGRDTFPNLNGYLVSTPDARTLVIRGATEKATALGVVGFLRRYVGVRQYWQCAPGGLGEVVPVHTNLFVPQVEWRDWPCVFSRWISQRPLTPGSVPLDFFRRNNVLPCGENYAELLPPSIHGDPHPEYFPFRNGRRVVPPDDESSGWQPCTSSPDVPQIMAGAVIAHFRDKPEAVARNVSVNDGGGDCECSACLAMESPGVAFPRRRSARYVRLTNRICERVEREVPSRKIVMLAYGATAHPPAGVPLHRMILPVISVGGRNAMQVWDEWAEAGADPMGLYLHHDDFLFFILPKLDLRQQARRIRHAVASGRAAAVYMEAKPHWPLSGLVSHITAELLWDPRQEVERLLDEYHATFFGPAAGPMMAFHETLEAGYERWLSDNGVPYGETRDTSSVTGANSVRQFDVLTLDEARAASDALRRAGQAVPAGSDAARRVEAVQRMFTLVEQCVQMHHLSGRMGQAKVTSEAQARRTIADARRAQALVREAAGYIADVLEQTPSDLEGAVFAQPGRPSRIVPYNALREGRPWPETVAAIKAGCDAVTTWLRTKHGQDAAPRWWDAVIAEEKEPELRRIFELARLASGAGELRTVFRSALDEVGRELAPPDLDIQAGDQEILIDQQVEGERDSRYLGGESLRKAGLYVRARHPGRAPFTLALTRKGVPRNVFALAVHQVHSLRLGFQARMTPGTRQARVGFLFKRNNGAAAYRAEVLCKTGGNDAPASPVAMLPIADLPDAWQQVGAGVELPEDARLITVFVHVERQAGDATCWFADAFIGEYAPDGP